MSKKDVDAYYKQMCLDYGELVENLKEMETLVSKELISPDRIDELKKVIEPIKNNYMRISYIMYLLDMPNRKEKKKKYMKAKNQDATYSLESIHKENTKILERLDL